MGDDDRFCIAMQHYVAWPLPKQEAPRQAPRHNVPFEGTSTEHDTYRQWELPRAQYREPESRVSLPFEGDSKYHEDYAPKQPAGGRTAGQKTPLADARPGSAGGPKFDGRTSNQEVCAPHMRLRASHAFARSHVFARASRCG